MLYNNISKDFLKIVSKEKLWDTMRGSYPRS